MNHFITQGMTTSDPMGIFMSKFFALFGEYEAAMLDERRRAGIARARAEGKHMGRPPDMSYDDDIRSIIANTEGWTISSVSRTLGKSRTFVRNALTRMGLDWTMDAKEIILKNQQDYEKRVSQRPPSIGVKK